MFTKMTIEINKREKDMLLDSLMTRINELQELVDYAQKEKGTFSDELMLSHVNKLHGLKTLHNHINTEGWGMVEDVHEI